MIYLNNNFTSAFFSYLSQRSKAGQYVKNNGEFEIKEYGHRLIEENGHRLIEDLYSPSFIPLISKLVQSHFDTRMEKRTTTWYRYILIRNKVMGE